MTTEENLSSLYASLKEKPALVITDSQVFKKVDELLPKEQKLTSFSILFARKKGDIAYFMQSLSVLETLPKHAAENADVIIHCGACMLTRNDMLLRLEKCRQKHIPVLNYALFLAWANGLFPRAIEPLPQEEKDGFVFTH